MMADVREYPGRGFDNPPIFGDMRRFLMRKLLLATVAVLGASMGVATVADAQTASPAPGTVTVRLNGKFRFYGFFVNDASVNNNAATTATGTFNAVGQGTATGTNKQANYGFANYARLYPGFDGVAANGLKYGASLEIRQDGATGAGGGVFGSTSQQERSRGALYLRREWGYIGTDQLGTIRLGSTDQPSSLYMTGNFENFNDGGLNGDTPSFVSGNAQFLWPFADVGSYYTTTKAIYLSPQVFGFDSGISYEPSSASINGDGSNGCGSNSYLGTNFVNSNGAFTAATGANGQGVSTPGCDRLSSTPSNAESARRRNTLDALLRYRGSFAGFGIAATAGYIKGATVKDNQSGVPFNSDRRNGATIRDDFDGVNVVDFGVALTYGGLTIGGKYQTGRYNGQGLLTVPHGAPNGEAYLAGISYTIGPVIVGMHAAVSQSAGDLGNGYARRQRLEHGLAAGGTYTVAPGMAVFLSYLYSERRQNGFNFITGQGVSAAATQGNAFNNKITSSFVSLGTSFTW